MFQGRFCQQESEHTMRMIEALESRKYLSVDLSASVAGSRLPGGVVNDVATRAAVTVRISNFGDTVPAGTAPVLVRASLRSAAGELTTVGATSVSVSKLAAGRGTRATTIPVTVPAGLDAGEYTLVVTVDPSNTLSDGNIANNSADGQHVTVAVANSDLVVSGRTTLSGSVEAGARGFAYVTLRNAGNSQIRTTAKVEVILTNAAGTRVVNTLNNLRVTLPAGRQASVSRISYSIPGDTADGALSVQVRVTPTGTLPGDDSANNTASLADLTIVTFAPASGPLERLGLDDTLTFAKIDSDTFLGVYTEEGTLIDSQGRGGRYELQRPRSWDRKFSYLQLFVGGRKVLDTRMVYFEHDAILGGRSLKFGADRDVADGYIELHSRRVYFALV